MQVCNQFLYTFECFLYLHRYFIVSVIAREQFFTQNKFINVIYSLHLLHTLSINSFEHSFLLEMIHFKCYLLYLFFSNSFVIYSSIHNKRKFQVRLVIFHTTTTCQQLKVGGSYQIFNHIRLDKDCKLKTMFFILFFHSK